MKKLLSVFLSLSLLFGNLGYPLTLAQEATTSATNQQTGSTSTNESANTATNNTDLTNTNSTNAVANTNVDLNSGSNDASNNTSEAAVNTGNSEGNVATSTTVNQNIVEPMPWTTWTGEGDWTTRNTQTGSNSNNTSTNTTTNNTSITNQNAAAITNNTTASSITGNNKASDNTGDATITTGTASFVFDGKNIVNLNGIAIWKGDGDWSNGWNGTVANSQTGSNSENNATNDTQNNIQINNSNDANLVNNLSALALSGSNRASDNTGLGSIQTGNANLVASLLNFANLNIVGTSQIGLLFKDIFGQSSEDVNLGNATYFNTADLGSTLFGFSSNSQTGSNSENNAANNLDNVFSINNANNGQIVNNLNLQAISGDNKASDNTGNGNILTGNSNIIATLVNFLNTNVITSNFLFGMINVFGEWTGNLILPEYKPTQAGQDLASLAGANNLTGSNSTNNAESNINDSLNFDNSNLADVQNNLNLQANTGANNSNDNTLGGKVTSGQSDVKAGANTLANQNIISDQPWWLVLINKMGAIIPQLVSPTGQVILFDQNLGMETLNQQTGSNSINNAANVANNSLDVNNQNKGSIVNNITSLADTGNNNSSDNTGTGTIFTGNASLLVSALNFINTNITTPNLMITLINIFDDWGGKIVSYEQAKAVAPVTIGGPPVNLVANVVSPTNNSSSGSGGNNNASSNSGNQSVIETVSLDSEANSLLSSANLTSTKVLSYFDAKTDGQKTEASLVVAVKAENIYSNQNGDPTNYLQMLLENNIFVISVLILAGIILIKRNVLNRFQLPFIKRG